MKKDRHLDTGKWGEKVVAVYLRKKGYKLLGWRIRIGRRDEFDIIARDGAELVFVEVKTRASEDFGRPAAAVDRHKRHVLSRAAVRYLKKLRNPRVCFRFDVVEVVGHIGDKEPLIRHIENAFSLDPRYRIEF